MRSSSPSATLLNLFHSPDCSGSPGSRLQRPDFGSAQCRMSSALHLSPSERMPDDFQTVMANSFTNSSTYSTILSPGYELGSGMLWNAGRLKIRRPSER